MLSLKALELAPHGITVNAYAPGLTDTPSCSSIYVLPINYEILTFFYPVQTLFDFFKERNIPPPTLPGISRVIKREEIAGLVSYLVSEEAAMITGESIKVVTILHINWIDASSYLGQSVSDRQEARQSQFRDANL